MDRRSLAEKYNEFDKKVAKGDIGRALYRAREMGINGSKVSEAFAAATPQHFADAITLAIRGGYIVDLPLEDIMSYMDAGQKKAALKIVQQLQSEAEARGHGDALEVRAALTDLGHLQIH